MATPRLIHVYALRRGITHLAYAGVRVTVCGARVAYLTSATQRMCKRCIGFTS